MTSSQCKLHSTVLYVLFRKMLVRTLRINTTAADIRKEYHTVRTNPRFHCCDHVLAHGHGGNLFFTRTARLWNDLPKNIFPECFNISVLNARVNQHFLLSPSSIYVSILLRYLFFFKSIQCNALAPLSLDFAIKKKIVVQRKSTTGLF